MIEVIDYVIADVIGKSLQRFVVIVLSTFLPGCDLLVRALVVSRYHASLQCSCLGFDLRHAQWHSMCGVSSEILPEGFLLYEKGVDTSAVQSKSVAKQC